LNQQRTFQSFTYRGAVYRICCTAFAAATQDIIHQRNLLEDYIKKHTEFQHTLEPIDVDTNAPEIAVRMARAGSCLGVGPMAAVAGAMAQSAAEAALNRGAREVIIDNGGDIFLKITQPAVIALYPGTPELTDRLAFSVQAHESPLAICSSSGRMGHSQSLGLCNLATVVARDAALADAAATQTANRVRSVEDVDSTLEYILGITGIDGVMIVQNDHVGLAGQLPSLVKIQ
jgi:ApbE superfamily uncharacterized protein (UPF0280 family)